MAEATRRAGSPARRWSTPAWRSSPARSRTDVHLDIPEIVRETIREIGYDHGDYGYDCDHISVLVSHRQAVARHRPGRRRGLRDPRRRAPTTTSSTRRRRRPGNDVRLRHRRDRGADADADPPRPPARRTARRGPQGRHARLPRPRRQDPGHGPLRRRPPGRGREASDLHPARRGRRLADSTIKPDLLGARGHAGARPRRPGSSTSDRAAETTSSSTRPASS